MPYINAAGYHNKNITYSIWHVFRIEDIVAHTLISGDEQILFSENYRERIGLPIITTGNELEEQQIVDPSKMLNLEELFRYAIAVKDSTDEILNGLSYTDLKRKMTDKDKEYLKSLNVVNSGEKVCWIFEYWCCKDINGLIQMPFSRHWIMHVEASLRIRNKLNSSAE